jgi:CRISPR-associated protein Cas5h
MPSNDLIPDKVLIFDVRGPMAHFRKYYTNSSSLSYLFPPRTVVTGLIAGLLGLPSEIYAKEDEEPYYERFGGDISLVAVSVRTKVTRMMQTVNYLATDDFPTKTPDKLLWKMTGGEIGHTQIPLEIILPENGNEITYRVYFYHANEEIYDEFKQRLEEQRFVFPPYMGITEFLASIEYIAEGKVSKNPKQEVELNSVCKLKEVELDFSGDDLQYITEKMPTGFLNDRTPKQAEEYVLEVKGGIMKVKLKEGVVCYTVSYSEDGRALIENIMSM